MHSLKILHLSNIAVPAAISPLYFSPGSLWLAAFLLRNYQAEVLKIIVAAQLAFLGLFFQINPVRDTTA